MRIDPIAESCQLTLAAGDYTDAALFGAVQNMGHNGIPRPDVLSVSWGGTEDVLSDALAVCAQSKYT